MELPRGLGIPHLGVYPEDMKAGSQRDIRTPIFTAALLTIARRWEQPRRSCVEG